MRGPRGRTPRARARGWGDGKRVNASGPAGGSETSRRADARDGRDGTPEKKSAGRVRRTLRVREGGDFGAPDLLVSALGLEELDEGVAHGAPAVEQVLELPVLGLVLGARGGGVRDDAATRRRRDLPRRRFVGPPPRRGASGRPRRSPPAPPRVPCASCVRVVRAAVRCEADERRARRCAWRRARECPPGVVARAALCYLPAVRSPPRRARGVTNAGAMTKCPAATGRDWPRRARGETSDARAVGDILTVREPPVRGLFRSRGNFPQKSP